MPELPEVETVRRGLAPAMVGAVFEKIIARRKDLRFPLPTGFVRRLCGKSVVRLDRRGKYLIADLSAGESLIMHLGMSGRFTISSRNENKQPGKFHYAPPGDPAHDHITFFLNGPRGDFTIDYNDPRRFGFMDLVATGALDQSSHFHGMGPEPLGGDFTPDALHAALQKRAAPIKAALLDQRVVAGLGNIYVCEALFRAGVSPQKKAKNISPKAAARLYREIVDVLAEAIDAGGSTLKDFAASDGALGYFQHRFKVYGREGDPCPVCGKGIRRISQSGRSTFYCGACQK